jgi:hypothetical protein
MTNKYVAFNNDMKIKGRGIFFWSAQLFGLRNATYLKHWISSERYWSP